MGGQEVAQHDHGEQEHGTQERGEESGHSHKRAEGHGGVVTMSKCWIEALRALAGNCSSLDFPPAQVTQVRLI